MGLFRLFEYTVMNNSCVSSSLNFFNSELEFNSCLPFLHCIIHIHFQSDSGNFKGLRDQVARVVNYSWEVRSKKLFLEISTFLLNILLQTWMCVFKLNLMVVEYSHWSQKYLTPRCLICLCFPKALELVVVNSQLSQEYRAPSWTLKELFTIFKWRLL